MIDFNKIFDQPDSIISMIENGYDTLYSKDSNQLINFVVNNHLIHKPFIRLMSNDELKIVLFMKSDDYEQFDSLKCFRLKNENKKIHVKALGYNIPYTNDTTFNMYELSRFVSVTYEVGNTECKK